MLRVGGALVFDDTLLPAVARAISFVSTYAAYKPMDMTANGSAVAFRKVSEDERTWDWHVAF